MSAQGVDNKRRRVLIAATSVVGAVGVGYVAVPFIASMNPSAKARAAGAPVEADISKLEPGAMLRVKWRGKPVWVVSRTEEMLAALPDIGSAVGGSEFGGVRAARVLQESDALDQAPVSRGRRYLHPSGMCADLPTRVCPGRPGTGVEGRLFLSLPRLSLRSGRVAFTRASRHRPTW